MKSLTRIIILALVLSFAGIATSAYAAEQTKCPVMGYTINKEIYADYEGKRVYFCCGSCISEFKKNPEKYIKKLEEQGVDLKKVPDEKK
jgi:YHS domain-containing protein